MTVNFSNINLPCFKQLYFLSIINACPYMHLRCSCMKIFVLSVELYFVSNRIFSYVFFLLLKWVLLWRNDPPLMSDPFPASSCDNTSVWWNGKAQAASIIEASTATRSVFGNIVRRFVSTTLDSCLNKVNQGKTFLTLYNQT